jgi:3-oxoacyl-[acyl-carrier protein] reductase
MFTSVKGHSVIVTGASKGIGRGIAKVFALQGAKVMVVARGEVEAKETVDEIRSNNGIAEMQLCDVTDWDAVVEMVKVTESEFGSVDVLCANAGIFPQTKIFEMDPEEWDQVMETNLKSAFLCVKACIPQFKKKGNGRIILTSSITGPVTAYPGWSHYGASKSGQLGFMKTAAMELSKYGTTINAVMPGNIYTEGLRDLGQDYLDSMAATIPLKRLGVVEDIGNAALFFASDEASYITGQTLIVDGGQILPESLEAIEEI